MFQFPPPRRGRRPGDGLALCAHAVSIPAPAQGASMGRLPAQRLRRRFNSRPRAGGVNGSALSLDDHVKFQFPPPRRGRRRLTEIVSCYDLFQFPPPRRGRPGASVIAKHLGIGFNSRPRAGGVNAPFELVRAFNEFQFPPPRRGRPQCAGQADCGPCVSIPAPAQGASSGVGVHTREHIGFNSRPRAGGV